MMLEQPLLLLMWLLPALACSEAAPAAMLLLL
jgi:hypothetical protein